LVLLTLTGSVSIMLGPAFHALLTEIVPEEALGSAMFLNSGQFNLARIIGPMIAALILHAGGTKWAFALNAVSFIGVIVPLLRVKPRRSELAVRTESIGRSVASGIDAVRKDRGLQGL
jgi:MFS family permease